jgi:carboxypeptidase C (cathepsin A)
MKIQYLAVVIVSLLATSAIAADAPKPGDTAKLGDGGAALADPFKPEEKLSEGSVTVGGVQIDYTAAAGTLVVHPKGWDDVPQPSGDSVGKGAPDDKGATAEASMFYVAYFKKGAKPESRPVTFLYNGGPGSASVWLHMGAFGPRRVVTADDSHTDAAPYTMVNNDSSLLDASDLVFIDAPGAGFSRIAGKDKEKAFYGVDADAYAFAEFITQFLTKYGRWNSPKYLFGESYGTTRSAVLVNLLETSRAVDVNGVILLSQILNFDNSPDDPDSNPGIDLPYELALPTYAATAWYHKKLPDAPKELGPFLAEVEHFAMNDYALALLAGASLAPADRQAIVAKLHHYTGLPADYIDKANLRINGGEFEKTLQADSDTTTGRLDTRFSGPTIDPLSKEADYDPQTAAIASAYVAVFNDYVRKELKYGDDRKFKLFAPVGGSWDFHHAPPGWDHPVAQATNVLPDLAHAMKYNPNLKVQLNAGYFDLATPYAEGVFELKHLPMPARLQDNIDYKFYESGHMVYAHQAALATLHDNVAAFIAKTYKHDAP